ncbi:3-oxoacyl-[acyl-carrier-protein] synthase-3 [Yoonia maritima]|uniref:3-oxoacyl-[acyl-carrier-protein] synthase-3 n=1 Tax=Yoonia maritima TaxID=1435347 RepID=A0A2T0VXS6_9RHOB|nr:3-oxoacyl-[acyl-carrier-protein] synthase III C-terminal domain-containing protein [Yoonia maritima]PRY76660.1 3-oxoacyl-[acyl-carrier-protein] synthase-3 [Yoonia maritima]
MLNIIDITIAYPERQEKLTDLCADLDLSRDQMRMFDRFFGFNQFNCDHAEPLQALMDRAAATVLRRNPTQDADLSHVVHCHTLMATGLFGYDDTDVLGGFKARGCETFSATMNHCATGVSMLGVFDKMLGPDDVGLILIGEKAFHPAIRVIENTTVMGEAAAAILVGRQPGPYRVIDTFTHHAPSFWKNTGLRDENYLAGFDTAYMSLACDSLTMAMDHFGRNYGQIRKLLPHNVNVPSWCQIAAETGIARDKLQLSTIGERGHCFGADPFINLTHTASAGGLDPADEVLLFSIGLGATASCALLQVA